MNTMLKNNNGKLAISITEMAEALGISRSKAHELVNEPGFPVVSLGRRRVIPVKRLEEWLNNRLDENNAL